MSGPEWKRSSVTDPIPIDSREREHRRKQFLHAVARHRKRKLEQSPTTRNCEDEAKYGKFSTHYSNWIMLENYVQCNSYEHSQLNNVSPINIRALAQMFDSRETMFNGLDSKRALNVLLKFFGRLIHRGNEWHYIFDLSNRNKLNWNETVNDYFGTDRHNRSSAWVWFTEYKRNWRPKGSAALKFNDAIKKTATMRGRWFINKQFSDLSAAFVVKLHEAAFPDTNHRLPEFVFELARPIFESDWVFWCQRLSFSRRHNKIFPNSVLGEEKKDSLDNLVSLYGNFARYGFKKLPMRQASYECGTDNSDESDTDSSMEICETAPATININNGKFIQEGSLSFTNSSKTPENSSLRDGAQCFNLISESESSCSVVELSQNRSSIKPFKPHQIEAPKSTLKTKNTCGKPIARSKGNGQPSVSAWFAQLFDESTILQTNDETYQNLSETYELLKQLCGDELTAYRVVAEIQRLGADLLTGVVDMDNYVHSLHTFIRAEIGQSKKGIQNGYCGEL